MKNNIYIYLVALSGDIKKNIKKRISAPLLNVPSTSLFAALECTVDLTVRCT